MLPKSFSRNLVFFLNINPYFLPSVLANNILFTSQDTGSSSTLRERPAEMGFLPPKGGWE
jgi:hypothetical protein